MDRSGAYRLWERGATTVARGLSSAVTGIWLGFFDAEHLTALTTDVYDEWDQYVSDAHNRSGLRAWEHEALERHFGDCKRIALAAAGGGREAIELAKRGFEVEAFECAPALASEARRLTRDAPSRVRVLDALPSEVPSGLETCDGAIVGWGGYMHIPARARRVRFLQALRAVLSDDAPLLLSFFLREPDARSFHLTARVATAVRHLRRSPEPVEVGDTLDRTFDHWFTRDEIETELGSCGFRVVDFSPRPYAHVVARTTS